jgi:hypothetical protein
VGTAEAAGRADPWVRIDAGRGLGLWVRYRANASMFVVSLNAASQQIELDTLTWIKDGSSLNFHLEELLDWPLAEGVAYRARMLIRHSFAELYLDDRLVKVIRLPGGTGSGGARFLLRRG